MSEATQQTGRFRLVKCAVCGKEFVPTSTWGKQIYCSLECARAAGLARSACRDRESEKAWRTAKRERERMRARLAERDAAYERWGVGTEARRHDTAGGDIITRGRIPGAQGGATARLMRTALVSPWRNL